MKVYNSNDNMELTQRLKDKLAELREHKGFNANRYIEQKARYLNSYMTKCGLDTCVVAISGGIDSAIVLGLIVSASKQDNSSIKEIIPVMLPAVKNSGVTNQEDAAKRGFDLCESLEIRGYSMDIGEAVKSIRYSVENILCFDTDDWAIGQLVPYTRTPFLYYITSLCTVKGLHPILVGTTNRDEGAYLGYVGKASDGMVDVQLISDIHKSEVYQVARALRVPYSILHATPAGDMYDNRCDTDVFGASYDFVELYLNYSRMSLAEKTEFMSSLTDEDKNQFDTLANNLNNLHRYNRHKYISRSPAVHLDLWDVSCPDGWINYYEITKEFMGEDA